MLFNKLDDSWVEKVLKEFKKFLRQQRKETPLP
jgi:hypothetical protein